MDGIGEVRDDVVDTALGCLYNFSYDIVPHLMEVCKSSTEDGRFGSFDG